MSDGQVSPNHSNRDHLRVRVRSRQKRKTTSCWPCRDRKVKCDKLHPCEICVKRGYPDLCCYERPNSQNPSVNPQPVTQTAGSSTPAQMSSRVESRPSTEVFAGINRHTSRLSVRNENREPFLGENAIPSFARDQASPVNGASTRRHVEAGFMPIIGHENTKAADDFLPIMADNSNILEGLPSNRDIIK